MNLLLTICARGGSKGIPGKNIKELCGVPLIGYTIAAAKQFADRHDCRIVVSTDSEQIKEVCRHYGLDCPYSRPDSLANDTVGKPDAIRDVMLWAEKQYAVRYDAVLDLDVTSPIRTLDDIECCVRLLEDSPEALTVFSVNPCARNPYFCVVEEKSNGFYGLVKQGNFTSRQTSPAVYDMNGSIYVYRREALDRTNPRAVTDRSLVYVMPHICFDLDEPEDYDYLEYLVSRGKISLPLPEEHR